MFWQFFQVCVQREQFSSSGTGRSMQTFHDKMYQLLIDRSCIHLSFSNPLSFSFTPGLKHWCLIVSRFSNWANRATYCLKSCNNRCCGYKRDLGVMMYCTKVGTWESQFKLNICGIKMICAPFFVDHKRKSPIFVTIQSGSPLFIFPIPSLPRQQRD